MEPAIDETKPDESFMIRLPELGLVVPSHSPVRHSVEWNLPEDPNPDLSELLTLSKRSSGSNLLLYVLSPLLFICFIPLWVGNTLNTFLTKPPTKN